MLISESYRSLNTRLHKDNPDFGVSGHKYSSVVDGLVRAYAIKSILDYGCGKGTLAKALPQYGIHEYDPCVVGKDAPPSPAELVICNDVLEHIEPECIHEVLSDLSRLTQRVGFLVVDVLPAMKFLPDGRNAHILQETESFWHEAISQHFDIVISDKDALRKILYIVRPKHRA